MAAHHSNWAAFLLTHGLDSYELDLTYQEGIHGRYIGADAEDIPLGDDSVDGMPLQCAFETFQGNADIGFIKEAQRLLKSQGALAIIPLYVDEKHFVRSRPHVDLRGVEVDGGAIRLWREDRHYQAFSRHYSPEAFMDRILSQVTQVEASIVHFTNLSELAHAYPGQRIYCDFMLYAKKPR